MSLINEMLNDLDKHKNIPENILVGLNSSSARINKNNKTFVILFILLFMLIFLFTYGIFHHKRIHSKTNNTNLSLPEKQIEQKPNPTVPPVVSESVKKPVSLEPAQTYEMAYDLVKQNKIPQAITMLVTILKQNPEQLNARELLASLYLDAHKFPEAEKVISDGLVINATDDALLELKAKMYVIQGRTEDAIALLTENPPTLMENPEYHSFIAALYQETGQHELAADIYKQLIAVQPNNAKWWMGLGIAYESEGNNNQALQAYANAKNIGGLNPEIVAYIDTRMRNA